MNNQFSQKISEILIYSKQEALRLHNAHVGPEHLLLGLIKDGTGKSIEILQRFYVNLDNIKSEIEAGFLHVIEQDGKVIAAFSIIGKEPTYDTIYDGSWPEGDYEYVTIHRVAGKREAHHVLKSAVETASKLSSVIRIDTHEDNKVMQALIKKYGFRYCGKITLRNGQMRLAFQRG